MTVYIYAIGQPQGPVKIGVSEAPWTRISTLQTGCPFLLEILYVQPLEDRQAARRHERHVHLMLSHHRQEGEWFSVTRERAIEEIIESLAIDWWNQLEPIMCPTGATQ